MANTYHRYKQNDEPAPGYRVTSCLGSGGFGEVWKGAGPGGTEVAIKIIDLTGQQGVQEFRSLRLVKKCHHPNLVPLHGYWLKDKDGNLIDDKVLGWSDSDPPTMQSGDQPTQNFLQPVELIIVMGLGSKCLHRRLQEVRDEGMPGLPPRELIDYVDGAARGIDFLTGQIGIVHGDIKPHNILIVGDAAAVCDFGLARAVESLRKTSMAPMTVAYAAPESFRGKPTIKSDQYSLAISYIELRTGRLPFEEDLSPYDLMNTHVGGELDLSRLPPYEREVVRRATALNPDERWNSCRDFARALQRAFESDPQAQLLAGSPYDDDLTAPGFVATLTADSQPSGPFPNEHIRQTREAVNHGLTPRTWTEMRGPGGSTPPGAAPPFGRSRNDPSSTSVHMPALPKKSLAWVAIAAVGVMLFGSVWLLFRGGEKTAENKQAPTVTSFDSLAEQVDNLTRQGKFALAVDRLDSAPIELRADRVQERQRVEKRDEVRRAWLADVKQSLDRKQIEPTRLACTTLLERFPADEEATRILAAVTVTAPPKPLPLDELFAQVDKLAQNQEFGLAIDLLAKLPNSATAEQRADAQKQVDQLRDRALTEAHGLFAAGMFDRAQKRAEELLMRFAALDEARLVRARCLLAAKQVAPAQQELATLLASPNLAPAERKLAQELAAWAKLSQGPLKGEAALQELLSLKSLDAPPSADKRFELSESERNTLLAMRHKLAERAAHALVEGDRIQDFDARTAALFAVLPSMQPLMLTQRIEAELDGQKFAAARTSLKQLAALAANGSPALRDDLGALQALVDLRDLQVDMTRRQAALAAAEKLSPLVSAERRGDLCRALVRLARDYPGDFQQPSVAFIQQAIGFEPDRNELYHMLKTIHGDIWSPRVDARLEDPTAPTRDQWKLLLADCTAAQAISDGRPDVKFEAARVEALLGLGERVSKPVAKSLIERATGIPDNAYLAYVAARAAVAAKLGVNLHWADNAAQLMMRAFTLPRPQSALQAPFRRTLGRQLLVEAARGKRLMFGASSTRSVLQKPYNDLYDMQNVNKWMRFAPTIDGGGAATVGERVNAALATYYQSKSDVATIKELAALDAEQLGDDALAVWLLQYELSGNSDVSGLVKSVRSLHTGDKKPDAQLIEFYNVILKPSLAKTGAEAGPLHAETARLLAAYATTAWPVPERDVEIDSLWTRALAASPDSVDYLLSRAEHRAARVKPDLKGAREDAAKAAELAKSDGDKARAEQLLQKLETAPQGASAAKS